MKGLQNNPSDKNASGGGVEPIHGGNGVMEGGEFYEVFCLTRLQ
ncbi:hypothetical protein [Oscillatoria acuminata]|nr:hypothetical protein [Oscillatoria acuminata]